MEQRSTVNIFFKIVSETYDRGGQDEKRHYYNEVRLDMAVRWRWYFDYRYALVKIQNPRRKVILSWGKIEPTKAQKRTIYERRLQGKKSTITKYENLMAKYLKTRVDLFPPESDPNYVKAKAKIERLKEEYQDMLDNRAELEKEWEDQFSPKEVSNKN